MSDAAARDIAIVFQDYGQGAGCRGAPPPAMFHWRWRASGIAVFAASRAHRRIAEKGRTACACRKISGGNVGRHAAAIADRALPRAGAGRAFDGRTVRRAGCEMTRQGIAGRGAVACQKPQAKRPSSSSPTIWKKRSISATALSACRHIPAVHRHRACDRSAAGRAISLTTREDPSLAGCGASCSISSRRRRHDPGARQAVRASDRGTGRA